MKRSALAFLVVLLAAAASVLPAQTFSFSTLAGQPGAAGNTDATGAAARFNGPTAVAVDAAGNVFVADVTTPSIRKVTPAGVVTTLATLPGVADALAVDAAGNVYAVDHVAHVVRRITQAGVVTVIAGQSGVLGIADGAGGAARFNAPRHLAIDSAGALYVCDTGNHSIRKITTAGVVTTLAGLAGVAGTADGPGPLARFSSPNGIAVDAAGAVYVSDTGNRTIRRISAGGEVATLAGSRNNYSYGDGTGIAASFNAVRGLAVDGSGLLYVADGGNNTLRRVTPEGVVTTIAGLGGISGSADGLGTNARFSLPEALAFDAAGNLYVADAGNHTLRKGAAIAAPTISTQPDNRTIANGQGTTFTVAASGGAPLFYRWERQAAAGGGFVAVTNNATFTGATTATLTLAAATTALNGEQFRCVVTNDAGSVASTAAVLTVTAPPIITNVASTTFYVGVAGTFLFTASGSPAPAFTVTSGALPAWATLNTATGALTGTPDLAGSPFLFTVTASNSSGTNSQSFTLSVQASPTLPVINALSAPRQVVTAGQSLTLSVSATGASLTYQWKRNGRAISGATAAAHVISGATTTRDAGYYQVVVGNTAGVTTSATIFVNVALAAPQVVAWGSSGNNQSSVPAGLTGVTAIAAGNSHSLALKADGTVVAWGYNGYSQATVPSGLDNVVAVDAGGNFSVALKADGTVSVWGDASFTTVPTGATNLVAIAAGANVCVALKADGTVIGWGFGWTTPSSSLLLNNIVAVGAGSYTAFAVRAEGTVVAWGSGYGANVPAGLAGVVAVTGGYYHALALKSDGTVVAWGENYYGGKNIPAGLAGVTALSSRETLALALLSNRTVVAWGETSLTYPLPAGLGGVAAVSAGSNHALALRDASADQPPAITSSPASVAANQGQSVTFTVAAAAGTAGINYQWFRNGTAITGATLATYTVLDVQAASAGQYYATATNSLGSAVSGVAALSVNGSPVVSATSGGRYAVLPGGSLSLALAPSISASATVQWRRNGRAIDGATTRTLAIASASFTQSGYYQAVYDEGAGAVTSAAVWVTIAPGSTQVIAWGYSGSETAVPAGLTKVTALAARSGNTLALQADGTVVRWGYYSSTPPAGLSNVVAIAVGYSQYLALRADGTVLNWFDSSSTPAAVPANVNNLVGIAAGTNHHLGLKANGTVVAWGAANYGATAVPVGLATVVAVAAGDGYSLALRADGTVIGWGRNASGESTIPAGLGGVVAIAAGSSHSLALKSDGTVVAWGYNSSGQATVPADLTGVVAIAAGDSHSLAQKADGTVVAWGYNSYNQTRVPAGLAGVFGLAAGNSHSVVVRNATGDTAPVFVSPPVSIPALTGQNVTLTAAAAAGTAPVAYQWRRAGAIIPGATSANLTLGAVTAASADGYDVTASNYLGSVTSAVATVTVSPTLAVTTNPTGRRALSSGQSLTLTATTALSGAVSLQWLRNGRPIAGATAASYAITGATWAHAGVYQVVATNSAGPATSAPVYVAVAGGLQVRAWGDNSSGQISVPVGLTDVFSVAAGASHSLVLKNDGTVTGWGRNQAGQASAPAGLSNVGAIAAGADFSMALGADGMVTTWGVINYTPAEVGAALAIAASPFSSQAMALRLDGSVVAWDSNGVRTDVPAGLSNVVAIATGGYYHIALKADGTVVTWGNSLTTPAGLNNVVAVGAGSAHLLALKADGTVVAWGGDAYYGHLSVPANLSGVVAIAAGSYLSFAIKADRSVVAWGTYSSSLTAGALAVAPVAMLSLSPSHGLALRDPVGDAPPLISVQSENITVSSGQNVTLSVTATAVPPPTYQWYRNGLVLFGATSSSLALTGITPSSAGVYSVTVSNALGSVSSQDITVTVNPSLNQRAFLAASARAETGRGITGTFTIEGSTAKQFLVRAVGPALAAFGIAELQADPQLTITAANGTVVATNDDWHTAGNAGQVATAAAAAGAFALPAGGRDAAVLRSFSPGTYHARVTGAGGAGGIVLLEIYDTDTTPRLVYVGTQAFAGGGNKVLVQGFALAGATPGRSYLIRALGPTLGSAGALADPELRVFNSANIQVAANDNWGGDSALATLAASVGAMPLSAASKDAALAFAPAAGGAYTIQVGGVGGASGATLVEIFEADAQRATSVAAAIVVPPQGVTVLAGSPVTLGTVAIGRPTPTFQWRKNGDSIPNATDATYTLAGVQTSDTGDYSVVVTNATGTAASAPAAVALVTQSATHGVVGPGYYAGSTVTVTNTLAYTGTAAGLGWTVTLPGGWSYAGGAGAEGEVRPAANATGTLEWAWNSPPASPLTFTYTLNVPAGQTGGVTLAATALVRTGATAQTTPVAPAALAIDLAPPLHTADTRGATTGSAPDGRIDLFELTRVIELYNTRNGTVRTGAYKLDPAGTSEDGFVAEPARAPDTPATLSRYHSADTTARDGAIGLFELTRVIELYNYRSGTTRTGQYRMQAGTEDGFTPGP